jgi:hypothetical protein
VPEEPEAEPPEPIDPRELAHYAGKVLDMSWATQALPFPEGEPKSYSISEIPDFLAGPFPQQPSQLWLLVRWVFFKDGELWWSPREVYPLAVPAERWPIDLGGEYWSDFERASCERAIRESPNREERRASRQVRRAEARQAASRPALAYPSARKRSAIP